MKRTSKIHRIHWVLSAFIVLAFVMVIAAIAFLVSRDSEWRYEADQWIKPRNAPACEDPLTIAAPMDMKRATSKLYPGQVRGTDFKPHGGLAIDDAPNTRVDIYAIRDASLVRASYYTENGVDTYLLDFMDSCGIMYRYDHLAHLAPQLAKYAPPLQPDSRTVEIKERPYVRKGSIIATAVGQEGNVGFDLGVYDLRKPNEASQTEQYQTDQRRIEDREQSFYAVCWFDLLPPADKAIVDALPSRSSSQEGTSSDYCQIK